MTDAAGARSPSIPADDLSRKLTVAEPDSSKAPHVAVAGDVYSILVSGAETAGRYCLIDMLVPDGGGPPPHRHDFEEMFTLIEGELELTFRGQTTTVRTGSTVSIPANAPHAFKNRSGLDARGYQAIAEAAQRAVAYEQRKENEEARTWRQIEASLKAMRGPVAS